MPIFELPGGSEAPIGTVVATGKIDHAAAALKRLPQQFKGKPQIEALLKILVKPAQELEDVFWTLAYERTIAKAVELGLDSILDLVGKLVGEPRDGKVNADYARFINARIVARRSSGLTETLIKVSKLVINDPAATIYVQNRGNATVEVAVTGIALDDSIAAILIKFLRASVSAGVRVLLLWSNTLPLFTWDVTGSGWDEGYMVDVLE